MAAKRKNPRTHRHPGSRSTEVIVTLPCLILIDKIENQYIFAGERIIYILLKRTPSLEAGTQNVHGAAGLLAGLRFVRGMGVERIARQEGDVLAVLARGLRKRGRYRVFDGGESSVLSVVPLDTDPETLADRLAERGVAVRAGLHCAPLAHTTAGTAETGTLRFSASVFNTPEEAERVLAML